MYEKNVDVNYIFGEIEFLDPEELLEDDEITPAEEGFLKGYMKAAQS